MVAQAKYSYFNPIGHPGKIPALDGLRAFAILLVLFRHTATGIRDNFSISESTNGPLWNMALNGWLGVDLFFVLSGFLVGYHIIQYWPSEAYADFFKRYWLKRVLRTFPLYYAVIFIVIFELVPLFTLHSTDILRSLGIHIVFMQDYMGTDLLVPLWSLATEEKFYFFAPFLIGGLLYAKKINGSLVPIIIGVLIILSIVIRNIQINETLIYGYNHFFWVFKAPFHFAIQGLLLGLAVAFLKSKHWQPNNFSIKSFNSDTLFKISIVILFVILISDEWMAQDSNWMLTSNILFLININFAVMVYACVNSNRLNQSWLGGPTLRLFARLSYSLYLIHYLLIPWSANISKNIIDTHWAAYPLFVLIYFGITMTAAYLLHITVEKPFLLLKEKIRP